MSWSSRTAGAPSMPVASEEEMTLEDLQAARAAGIIDDRMYQAALARMRARVNSEGAPLGSPAATGVPGPGPGPGTAGGPYDWEAPLAAADARWARQRQESAARQAQASMPGPMTGTTEEYQDYAGIPRSPTSRLQDEGRDMAARRRYGARAGGGEAFASDEERAAYGRRNVMSQAERNEMARGTMFPVPQAPMTPGQIVDAQRSQADRDMAKSGISGSAGWAPVYVNGEVVYYERAPDEPGSPRMPAEGEQGETIVTDEVPAAMGMTNAAEGNRRTGPRVEAGEFSPSLGGRQDLVDRGYVQKTMQGPYGPERVWVKENVGVKARDRLIADGMPVMEASSMSLADYQERQRTEGIRRRLMNSAGISSADAAGMSVAQIRELSKDRRAAQKAELSEAARIARMGNLQRNELALGRLPPEWQNAIEARRFDMSQTTPLDVQAAEAKMAFDLARGMVQGQEQGNDVKLMMYEQQQSLAAADEAVRIGQELGVSPSGYRRATPDQLREIEERVEAKYPGRGKNAIRGWSVRPPYVPPPAVGPAVPPSPGATPPYPGVF